MQNLNIENINAEYKEFKTSETKYKQNDIIKTKKSKNIAEFVESI